MSENLNKKFKATCLFPLVKYNARILYNEVKKASGISYIILNLIQNDLMRNEKVLDVFSKFGIPKDLHYIFLKEIKYLVAMDILNCDINESYITDVVYASELTLSDFNLTEKGNKMFREGAIPTGNEKETTKILYYSPLTNKFSDSNNLRTMDINDSYLNENIINLNNVTIDMMEEYLTSIKKRIGLKDQELISKVDYVNEEIFKFAAYKEDNMDVNINSYDLRFDFKTSDENSFFEEYYDRDLIKKILESNEKFNFKLNGVSNIEYSNITNINDIYLPGDIDKLAKSPCELFITDRPELFNVKEDKLIDDLYAQELLKTIDSDIVFAIINNKGCKIYLPYNVNILCKNIEEPIYINLLIEKIVEEDEYKTLLKRLFTYYVRSKFNIRFCKKVIFIAKKLNEPLYAKAFTTEKLNEVDNLDQKIDLILQLKNEFNSYDEYKEIFKEEAQAIFDEYIKTINVENIIEKNIILRPLKEALNINNYNYIKIISENLVKTEKTELVFAALDSAGFKETDILPVANVVEIFMDKILNKEEIEHNFDFDNNFISLNSRIWELCDMIGIRSENDYTLSDNYNIDNFFNCYTTLKSILDNLKQYRVYANDQFKRIDNILKIIEPIHEFLSIERTASSHPEKITEKIVRELIARGKNSEVVTDLLIKLQFELRKILPNSKDLPANELIDLAKDKKIISRNEHASLNKLRLVRNRYQHPEKEQFKFSEKDLNEWKDIVFNLKGDKK